MGGQGSQPRVALLMANENKITGAFPLQDTDPDTSASALRLCVFMNVLQTLHHHLLENTEPEGNTKFDSLLSAGHRTTTLLLVMGALKEGTDAMVHFGPRLDKLITALSKTPVESKPIEDAYARIKKAVDKTDPQSFSNRVLKNARDDAAFHWRLGSITAQTAATPASNAPFVIVRDGGKPISNARFTLADELLARIGLPCKDTAELSELIKQVRALSMDIIVVLGTILPLFFKQRGCVLSPL